MTRREIAPQPLLCELHSHTTWSDGRLRMDELIDLYGTAGFDVLCVTDHVVRATDPCGPMVDAATYNNYLESIGQEAERALREYDLLVIPGVELTDSDPDPDRAAHALAVGLERLVTLEHGLPAALTEARAAGAATIAAHPHSTEEDSVPGRTTRRFSREPDRMRPLIDRYELINRADVFSWVAAEGLPGVASGDFHTPAHLETWKTVLPCEKATAAVVAHLRSDRPCFVTRFAMPAADAAA
jgi:predicted metal-dependent phosphoesterase TrpH